MADDWDTVTVLRKRAPNKATMKSETAVNQARRQGAAIDTNTKCEFHPILIPSDNRFRISLGAT